MPGVTQYIADPNSRTNAYRAQEDAVRNELRVRTERTDRNWRYYNGDHKKHLADDESNTDDNVRINLYGLAVEKSAAVLNSPEFDIADNKPPTPAIEPRNGVYQRLVPEKTEDQIWLDALWEVNNKELFIHNQATTSGVTGDNFIKVIPDVYPAPEGVSKNPDGTDRTLPRLILLNPCHVTAFWDEGDKDRALAYRIQYGKEGSAKRQEIVWQNAVMSDRGDGTYVEDQAAGWVITDWEQRDNRRTWIQVDRQMWGYEWPPIVHWQNLPDPKDFYGSEDVEDSNLALNDSLNFVASNIQRIIKYHADPKAVAIGAKANEKINEQAVNRIIVIENEKADLKLLEMQGDLKSSMDFAKMLRRAFFDGTRETDPATVEDRVGVLTNFGLRVLFGDKVKKAESKRMMAGMGLTEICQHALELGGFGAGRKVVVKWQDLLPADDIAQATALGMDVEQGLSKTTYLDRRGYDTELEIKRRSQENAESVLSEVTTRQGAMLDTLRNGNRQPSVEGGR
jgi:hypothetical protein